VKSGLEAARDVGSTRSQRTSKLAVVSAHNRTSRSGAHHLALRC
jgi:hypothetical protein